MITRKMLRGPAAGKKVISTDKLSPEKALNSLRMDIDMGFKIIGISDMHILLEYYEGAQYEMGTHIRYDGTKPEMKKLTLLARTFEVVTATA